jgi:hypothetical protein
LLCGSIVQAAASGGSRRLRQKPPLEAAAATQGGNSLADIVPELCRIVKGDLHFNRGKRMNNF